MKIKKNYFYLTYHSVNLILANLLKKITKNIFFQQIYITHWGENNTKHDTKPILKVAILH